jgi:Na+/proline symporter
LPLWVSHSMNVSGVCIILLCSSTDALFNFATHSFVSMQVIVCTLASQAVDSNALLGASTLSYKYHYWDGVVLPMGLGLSLINNAIWLARHINHDYALTLPDVLSKRYGKVVEILVSIFCCTSFLCLLAGNLVGMGAVLSYLVNISQEGAIWVSTTNARMARRADQCYECVLIYRRININRC